MSVKLPELEKLLVSKSGMIAGNFKTATFVTIGVYLLGTTLWRYFSLGITDNAAANIFIGLASFFALKYQKLIYISPVGVVKETHTWITHHREVMKWEDIKFITIMYKRGEAMVFFERDVLGWKVLFDESQIDALKELFKKYVPKVTVNDIKR